MSSTSSFPPTSPQQMHAYLIENGYIAEGTPFAPSAHQQSTRCIATTKRNTRCKNVATKPYLDLGICLCDAHALKALDVSRPLLTIRERFTIKY